MKNNIFTDRLNELMQEQNINTKQLSRLINAGVTSINTWRRGESFPSYTQLINIANYFECSLDYLVGRSESLIEFKVQECPPFYSHLRSLMKGLNVSRYEINKNTKVKSSHFVDWSRGLSPSLNSLIELADYLKITLDELVGRE